MRSIEEIRQDALVRVREHYENIDRLSALPLELVNQGLEPDKQYRSVGEYRRELGAMAGAVSSFAVNVGLITAEQLVEVLQNLPQEPLACSDDGPPRGHVP